MTTCRSVSRTLLPAVLILVSAGTVEAQQPLGGEFQVSSTLGNKKYPSVASDSAGNFVVVWGSLGQDGSNYAVIGQRYAGSGGPLGTEFLVNSFTTQAQRLPSVASDPAGNFVVVWQSYGEDGSFNGIFGQRYASGGGPLGTEFRVNTFTPGFQESPSVASDSAGDFVVTWMSLNQDGGSWGVFGQRYSGSGGRLGTEFQINTYNQDGQSHPRVTTDSAGDFVVVWESNTQDGSNYGVFGQRLGSGTEFQASTFTTNSQKFPWVASDAAGNFTVVWQGYGQDGSLSGVFGQRYGSSGTRSGAEFRVNTYTSADQAYPSVAADSAGNFVVVWHSGVGFSHNISGQRYDGSGARLGAEFRANTTVTDDKFPVIASDPAGNFVVVWERNHNAIFGQRYCGPSLSAVSVSATGFTSICPGATGGTATVTDTGGGGAGAHQWFYRLLPAGTNTAIPGQTGTTYQIAASDFLPGLGDYALVCQTIPLCGSPMFSPETVTVTITNTDGTAPSVTAPANLTTTQTLCQ